MPVPLCFLQVCSALGQIAKHSVDLAEVVVEAEVFPKCLTCLKYPDEFVQKVRTQGRRQGRAQCSRAAAKRMHPCVLNMHAEAAAVFRV